MEHAEHAVRSWHASPGRIIARVEEWLARALETHAPAATILVRVAVGVVFLGEGVQKFLFPDALGAGRFAQIGIPAPDVMGPFVGVFEVLGGVLVLIGLLTRLAAVPLVIDMLVAIASTKIPILIGHGYWRFAEPSSESVGLWAMLHESRTDLSMLLAAIFLLVVGAGQWSLDAAAIAARSGARGKRAPRDVRARGS